jgi:hypothetical protein
LRVVDDDYVCTALGTGGEGPAFDGPVPVGVLQAPVVEYADLVGGEVGPSGVDTLEDVVVVFGDAEDFGFGAGDVPVCVSGCWS